MTQQSVNSTAAPANGANARGVSKLLTLQQGSHGRGFYDYTISPQSDLAIDPFLVLSDFVMSQPFFPPHPHAGFSVMTYMFPDSVGAFINRDSFGDHSRIEPGALHWTQAARGIQHEEVPEVPGQYCHGLQMWVNLAAVHKHVDPAAAHINAVDVPELRPADGVVVRVVAGSFGDRQAAYETLTNFTLLDVYLAPNTALSHQLPNVDNAFVLAIDGSGTISGSNGHTSVTEHSVALFSHDGDHVHIAAGSQPFHFLLAHGRPLAEPVVFGGPFVMNSQAEIIAARTRFSRGEMGLLAPSVDFGR